MSVHMKIHQELQNFYFTETDLTIIEFQLVFSDDCYWHNSPLWYNELYGKCNKQATYLQMNDTHTTHWSVQYSVYIGTSYMCIKVVLEYNVKDHQIAPR